MIRLLVSPGAWWGVNLRRLSATRPPAAFRARLPTHTHPRASLPALALSLPPHPPPRTSGCMVGPDYPLMTHDR